MNVRELKRLAMAADDAPAGSVVAVPARWVKDLVAVAIAAKNHVDSRGAYQTELGKAVAQLEKGNGGS